MDHKDLNDVSENEYHKWNSQIDTHSFYVPDPVFEAEILVRAIRIRNIVNAPGLHNIIPSL